MKKIFILIVIVFGSLISCDKETCKTCVTTTGHNSGLVTYESNIVCGDDLKHIKVGAGSWVYTDSTMTNITCY